MITDKIHNQFLSQAQVWSGTAKQDNFFNEVNTEDANNTFDKLAMNLTVKLQDIKGIADKPTPDIQSGKKVLDNGAILTEWNTLAKIIISPKTKSEVAETLKNKLYSLEDVINKICYDYTVFIKQFTDTKPKTFALQHINQLISSLGIFLVMQKQLLSKTLSEITYNQIKDFMSFDTVRKILSNATVGTSWIASFDVAAKYAGYIAKYDVANNDNSTLIADRTAIMQDILNKYNELLKYTPAEVQAKRENLANGLLLSLYGANPRTARVPEVQRERRIRFLKALENAQKLETNFMNQNYNDRVERIINLI
jgi:hypothetical protein